MVNLQFPDLQTPTSKRNRAPIPCLWTVSSTPLRKTGYSAAGRRSLVVGDEKEGGSVAEKGTWGELEGELLTPSPLGHGCTERGAFRFNQQCLWQPLLLASAVTQRFLHCWVHKVLV
jgi:hypothetical protein